MYFDISSIPKKSPVKSAKLILTCDSTRNDPTNEGFLGIITTPWDNNCNWSTPWITDGGDYTKTATMAHPPRVLDAQEVWDVTVAVNKWVQGTQPNYGLMRYATGIVMDYYYDNTAVQSKRAKLVVEYEAYVAPTPVVLSGITTGQVKYRYFEQVFAWAADVAKATTPTKEGMTTKMDLSQRSRDLNYGMEYSGYINIPLDGQYTLYTVSDDGSVLYIGADMVVDNDGLHGDVEKSGVYQFKKGYYPIKVVYLQIDGGANLKVYWSGPGIAKTLIPISQFATGTVGSVAVRSVKSVDRSHIGRVVAGDAGISCEIGTAGTAGLRIVAANGSTMYQGSVTASGVVPVRLPKGMYCAVLTRRGASNMTRLTVVK